MHDVKPVDYGRVNGTPYFNCVLQSQNTAKKAVCFTPSKRKQLSDSQLNKSPVKMAKLQMSPGDYVITEKTQIKAMDPDQVGFKFNSKLSVDTVVNLLEMETLASGQIINANVEVAKIDEPVIHQSMNGPIDKQNVIIRDNHRCRKLILYGQDVGKLVVGKFYQLSNLRLHVVNNNIYLNTTKSEPFVFKEIQPIENLVSLPEESILSEVTIKAKIVGINSIKCFYLCPVCNKKCDIKATTLNCRACKLTTLVSAGTKLWSLSASLITANRELHTLYFPNDFVHRLSEIIGCQLNDEDWVVKELLEYPRKLMITFDMTNKHVGRVEKA